ncbi:MAG: Holliday junction resolvase RuvX [Deltaproteobacteria bacterium]|nr:Holliday junction resolvase RuvX [Deltaproteobacteria bacterium]
MPLPGVIVALDVGTAKIGVAACDAGRTLVFPVTTVMRRSVAKDAEAIAKLSGDREAKMLVVGLPDQNERMAKLARQVGDAVATRAGLPVHYHDEGFSSAEARARIEELRLLRSRVDEVAATVILESWLATQAR